MLNFLFLIGGNTSQDLEILLSSNQKNGNQCSFLAGAPVSIIFNQHSHLIQTSSIMVVDGGRAEVDDNVRKSSVALTQSEEAAIEQH